MVDKSTILRDIAKLIKYFIPEYPKIRRVVTICKIGYLNEGGKMKIPRTSSSWR